MTYIRSKLRALSRPSCFLVTTDVLFDKMLPARSCTVLRCLFRVPARNAGTFGKECGPNSKKPLMDLECKVAVVTGGATGIGYATAYELLNASLFRVVLADIDACVGRDAAKSLNSVFGANKACFMPLNVCCAKQMEDVLQETINRFGALDIVVNNAAFFNEKRWELEVDTNVKSVVYGSLIGTRLMEALPAQCGFVVNVGATVGLTGCPFAPVLAATKAAINQFSIGYGLNGKGVRVIGLAPGKTETNMLKDMGSKMMFPPSGDKLGKIESAQKQKPGAVGRAIVYLAQYAQTGTLWSVEDNQLMRVKLPNPCSYSYQVLAV